VVDDIGEITDHAHGEVVSLRKICGNIGLEIEESTFGKGRDNAYKEHNF